ncbi:MULTISPECIES: competence/damage-inducible protein A [unclassified Enterococcus]|uniref:competence/damage-inducible protein A n=1 Tax=unclassified Enterococcus TaxID=2608891 RepID=UPI0015522427|nr:MULTISPECIES: competence/damage-inducible protein A [unclassified Enterococcus]MBS7578419.1 competence/damage-inducible protein A [Enterococcus sp. MMGLQ5-2]MBS7585650.1 competence/damage-inducible protein A [Enterococcus sp. MMGLQ5-1]NPD13509.1 competence/damage-inducible protein A [Enterococcus sp. MMGLQ5-1]NPD38251.1 competence/damage-inducible protein A [Enterococcus sp. MMGLQ5-2]
MKAEIIAVGTELLTGQVVNTNVTYISEQLATLGIDVYFHTSVGDNPERMTQSIQIAESRSDLIILCGGLGPTDDDITKQILAKHLNKKLIIEPQAMQNLDYFFQNSQYIRTPNNDLQALIIDGAKPLQNRTGLAVGSFLTNSQKQYAILPGPPSELKPMFTEQLMPLLNDENSNDTLFSRVIRFFGIGESQLVTRLDQYIKNQTDPTIAPYAKTGEVTLRLSTKAKNLQDAESKLNNFEQEIVTAGNLSEFIYGYGEDNSIEKVAFQLLKKYQKTITAAESLTAGLFQATLAKFSGASEIFPGGFVTYSADTKARLLDIPLDDLKAYGVVSEWTAKIMAEQAQAKLNTDYAISFTGVAGPENLENQPVGTVWLALARKNQSTITKLVKISRDRDYIRKMSVMHGMNLIIHELNHKKD